MPGIEIRQDDLAERPANFTPGQSQPAKGKGNILDTIKEITGVMKELKEAGIDVKSLMGNFMGGGQKQNTPGPQVVNMAPDNKPSGMQVVMGLAKVWQAAYGDVTINELLEKLKEDYGGHRISQITQIGGFLK